MLWIVWYWKVKVENYTMDWGSGPDMFCQRDEGDWMSGQRGKGGVLYGFGALCRLYHSVRQVVTYCGRLGWGEPECRKDHKE